MAKVNLSLDTSALEAASKRATDAMERLTAATEEAQDAFAEMGMALSMTAELTGEINAELVETDTPGLMRAIVNRRKNDPSFLA